MKLDKCASEEEGESEDNSDEEVESQESLDGEEHVDPEWAEGNDECVSDVIDAECIDDGRDNGKDSEREESYDEKEIDNEECESGREEDNGKYEIGERWEDDGEHILDDCVEKKKKKGRNEMEFRT